MTSSAPSAAIADALSFRTLKVPHIADVIAIFKSSHEFKEIQSDNPLDVTTITSVQLWEPFLVSTVKSVSDNLVTKKYSLAAKQKLLTKRLEDSLFLFANTHHQQYEIASQPDLSGYMMSILSLHGADHYTGDVQQCHRR